MNSTQAKEILAQYEELDTQIFSLAHKYLNTAGPEIFNPAFVRQAHYDGFTIEGGEIKAQFVAYYCGDADYEDICFKFEDLDADPDEFIKNRIANDIAAKIAAKEAEANRQRVSIEKSERETYERLHAQFGGKQK